MNEIIFSFGMIVSLFIFFLIAKEFLSSRYKDKVCVICFSVSTTWIILLILNYLDYFQNTLIIALFMGQSVLGLFYILENRIKEEFKLFLLPILLTLSGVAYILLNEMINELFLFLIGLWALLIGIYSLRQGKKVRAMVNRITACCKNW